MLYLGISVLLCYYNPPVITVLMVLVQLHDVLTETYIKVALLFYSYLLNLIIYYADRWLYLFLHSCSVYKSVLSLCLSVLLYLRTIETVYFHLYLAKKYRNPAGFFFVSALLRLYFNTFLLIKVSQ